MTATAIRDVHAVLSGALQQAVVWGWRTDNPATWRPRRPWGRPRLELLGWPLGTRFGTRSTTLMRYPGHPGTQGPGVLSICPIGEVVLPTDPLGAGGGLRRRIPAMGVIDDYLEDLGDSQRAELERIRRIVLDRVPDAEEGRSYGMPAFRYKRKPLLGFAALKDHLSLFPFSPHVVAAVKGRLAGYDLSKGTIRFTEAKPIPEDVIWEILDLRLEEIS